MSETRLLSPDDAAPYLGLGSRWAIYRLISAGQLPALRLAGKLRIDRGDLDALIAINRELAALRAVSRGFIPLRGARFSALQTRDLFKTWRGRGVVDEVSAALSAAAANGRADTACEIRRVGGRRRTTAVVRRSDRPLQRTATEGG